MNKFKIKFDSNFSYHDPHRFCSELIRNRIFFSFIVVGGTGELCFVVEIYSQEQFEVLAEAVNNWHTPETDTFELVKFYMKP